MSTPTDNLEETIIGLASRIEESSEGEAEKLATVLDLKGGDRLTLHGTKRGPSTGWAYLGATGQWLLCDHPDEASPVAFNVGVIETVKRRGKAKRRQCPLCKDEGLKLPSNGDYCTRLANGDFSHVRGESAGDQP